MDTSTRAPATGPSAESTVELTVKGALDGAAVRGLSVVLDRILARHPLHLVIDLTDCPFLDAAAIEVLVDAHRRVWRTGGLLSLRNPSPRIRRILEIARLDHVLRLTVSPPLQSAAGAPTDPEPAAATTGPERRNSRVP